MNFQCAAHLHSELCILSIPRNLGEIHQLFPSMQDQSEEWAVFVNRVGAPCGHSHAAWSECQWRMMTGSNQLFGATDSVEKEVGFCYC